MHPCVFQVAAVLEQALLDVYLRCDMCGEPDCCACSGSDM